MKKILIVFVISIISVTNTFSQIEIVKSNTSSYYIESEKISMDVYTINNNSIEPIYLWFDKDKGTLSQEEIAYHYFYQVKKGNDFSFYNMAIEVSSGSARMSDSTSIYVYDSFIKELFPGESFIIIVKNPLSNQFSEQYIATIPISEIQKWGCDLIFFNKFKYQGNVIVF